MDMFSSLSDPLSFSWSPETSVSDGRPAHFSDEESFLLASNHPKKRAGRKKFRETRHPVYRGVRRRNSSKWVCEVREPNNKSRIWLGTFPTAEMAARAHDVAAIALRGRMACLNFADSAWRLPVPASADPKDIKKTAADAAEAFRTAEVSGQDLMNDDVAAAAAAEEEMSPEKVFFMDEEAIFDEQGLFADMATGLGIPPPHSGIQYFDDVEVYSDVSLWSYSI